MAPINVSVGERFTRLRIVSEIERRIFPGGQPARTFLCQCDCGSEVVVALARLRSGMSKSCGCLRAERASELTKSHGYCRAEIGVTPEYRAWSNMHDRCRNQKRREAIHYIGRGITVCSRWNDFQAFLDDMGRRPSVGHSIDRIDNDKGYSPENCRWATRREQSNNRRCTVFVEVRGQSIPLVEAAELLGVPYGRLAHRHRRGLPLDHGCPDARNEAVDVLGGLV